MINGIIASQALMAQQGHRRLLVLSGDADWARQQAIHLSEQLPGDWLWVGDNFPPGANGIRPTAAKTLLGQEGLHGVFDATDGLNTEALAVLAGVLRAGSWLLLLVPAWDDWALLPDSDSLRWSEQSTPISTPNFIHHMQRQLLASPDVFLWQQGQLPPVPQFAARPNWQPPDGTPTTEQQAVLQRLMQAQQGVWVLTAARGRGKSTLAGMLVAQWPGKCWVTGPGKAATQVLSQRAGDRARFWAPDALLEYCQQHDVSDVDWLLIDEAAAIPTALLSALLAYFPRALLTTTVQGYEGTGRGFLLKFCATLNDWHHLTLTNPIRWASHDPLEQIIDDIMLFNDDLPPTASAIAQIEISGCEQQDWLNNPELLCRFYGLLSCAHYRTTPLDLRRLLDAPGMHFSAAKVADSVIGALWLVDEGGLDSTLAHEVWAGKRRPKGSLVAQSLAAHSGQWQAPTLLSRRISRVAVAPLWRQQGIARQMIAAEQARAQGEGLDFLSVSFGYTAELACFWHACGFQLVRMGSHKEASSGCYAAMAILPLSLAGQKLCGAARQQLERDWYWLQQWVGLETPVSLFPPEQPDITLNDDDWRELAGFAFAFRPLEASLPALQRLLLQTDLPLPALRQYLQQGVSIAEIVRSLGLAGRKALAARWRQEAAEGFNQRVASVD
ncbi:TPA: tRNA(Met) cytidine acetyltransferase [Yersinia enterocolitica]|uniref:tRNA(Met) cytidine acetyltransferase TmcA n=1 Tax=Yersinia enterocolitica TaxID=630 RepID=UPI000200B757|nr:GNAT family N-acetyltransferase [Yersinia enterocolitica]NGN38690.1 tRNA(Met) cytidine acetyltransferase [Yersinia enterocolitica subsp. palearctica]ADZ43447.1 putative acetyltransferase [Yersinia enterocolitica subsp. palearctica 105.5R(r)]ALG79542.1 methionine tRNA cytidine acetyltransferase [Yersinia enterocolitica]MDA5486941.1 GNAT family N-acetyltransferase [Yersinia enterocolitica]HDL7393752.1 tRNA(Met) cytidine acetyltransferase [Yersinia enterocolitica]